MNNSPCLGLAGGGITAMPDTQPGANA